MFKSDIEAKQVAAIIFEPVQGEGGFNVAPKELVAAIRRLCDEHNVPIATNLATAEMLIQGLARGDLDWREIAHPRSGKSAL